MRYYGGDYQGEDLTSCNWILVFGTDGARAVEVARITGEGNNWLEAEFDETQAGRLVVWVPVYGENYDYSSGPSQYTRVVYEYRDGDFVQVEETPRSADEYDAAFEARQNIPAGG